MAGLQADPLAERYGRRRRSTGRRRLLLAAAVAAVLAGVGWSAWVARSAGRQPVRWQSVAFSVQGDAETVVTFDVTSRAGVAVVCTVEALNASRAQVGLLDVRLPATAGSTRRATARVPTSERAVAGGVRACAPTR